ncbi:MAG: ATP-binding protein [Holophagaceae bacterium]|nr:ATP-binding protein [Holophagaceae bacterium]
MHARHLASSLSAALEDTPVVFLAGARQTGKSTLVQAHLANEARERVFRTFDDLGTLAAVQADPEGFIASLGERAFLDEIQRAPKLFLPIKASVDRHRMPGRFVLTGSANVLTLPKVSESLAGRMEILTLWPLAQSELEGVTSGFVDACFHGNPQALKVEKLERRDLLARVLRGGYPEVVTRKSHKARTRWFEAYLTTVIQRDLRDLSAIDGIAALPRLLQSVALRVGSPLNMADLGRTLGLNQMTLKRYLTLFEALYLVKRLPPWFENMGKRLAKTPKLYFNDAGLLGYLLDLDPESLDARPTLVGPLVENFVVMELTKLVAWSLVRPSLYHMRTSAGLEVDIVMENRKRELVGIEVKASMTLSDSDFKGLRELQKAVGKRMKCGVVLYGGREILPFGKGLWAMPIQALWGVDDE